MASRAKKATASRSLRDLDGLSSNEGDCKTITSRPCRTSLKPPASLATHLVEIAGALELVNRQLPRASSADPRGGSLRALAGVAVTEKKRRCSNAPFSSLAGAFS
jgi:hypothetical protein